MRKQLQIADLVLAIESDGCPWEFPLGGTYQLFEVGGCAADLHLRVRWSPREATEPGQELFSVTNVPAHLPPTCRVFRDERGVWSIEANDSSYDVFRRRVAVLGPDLRRGDLYLELRERDLPVYPNPFGPPLDRMVFVQLMARRGGMLVHGCGVIHEGHGLIFVGPSGAGKTTLARLWSQFDNAVVLGEECLALRTRDSRFWVFGTPWIGESQACSPLGAPVAGIYLIRHAQRNSLEPLAAERAAEKLLSRSFLASYDAEAAYRGLDFCLDLVGKVPVYDYGFVPDESAVRFLWTRE